MDGGSKKRTINEVSNGLNNKRQDEATLFRANHRDADFQPNIRDEDIDDDQYGDQDDRQDSDEGEGDDLYDNMEGDYEAKPHLDKYEEVGLNDDVMDLNELSYGQRAEVDRRLNQEDQLRAAQQSGRRVPGALMGDEYDAEDDHEEQMAQYRQERFQMMREEAKGHAGDDDHAEADDAIDYDAVQGPLASWLKRRDVISFVLREFQKFLKEHNEDKIHEMCQNNLQSLHIVYNEFSERNPTQAIWLAEEPALMLPILDEVAMDVILQVYPDYNQVHEQVFVRVRDLPVEDKLRDLRQSHLNALVKIRGVVTKRTSVFPELKKMFFECANCLDEKGPIYHSGQDDPKQFLGQCVVCQSKGPFHLKENKSVYRNYQKWTVQETPGTVPPGRVPRQKEVYILNDLVDSARPGDEVEITGIFMNRFDYGANIKHGFPVFSTMIEANNVTRFGDEQVVELTTEDKEGIRAAAKRPKIATQIFNSIAPSIFGHDFIKKGLTLAMFGGVPKDVGGKHRTRGDINMLLLGDPGTAKSQFLKYVEQVFPRVVYTTGKGASAVGLTAGVHRDPVSQEWTLEAGALVLADKGVCLIDEFDKMNDQDRTSIHEAMEQQSISISKAGIITSLQARCSVIAAANPIKGTYQPSLNFNDNVDLTDPILSRFDLLAVVRDEVEEDYDDALATFVINSHIKNHPDVLKRKKHIKANVNLNQEDRELALAQTDHAIQQNLMRCKISEEMEKNEAEILDQEFVKKYLIYAKRFVQPKLSEIDKDKISNFYADIRRESSVAGGIPIAVRHIESVVRMSEAYARLHLRDYVRLEDIDFAIQMLLDSFLQSQKLSIKKQLERKFEKYRTNRADITQLLLHQLNKQCGHRAAFLRVTQGLDEHEKVIVKMPVQQFETEARDHERHHLAEFYRSAAFLAKYRLVENETVIETRDKF